MILPTKDIPVDKTLLNSAMHICSALKDALTVSELWENVREVASVGTFERFILSLDMLYILNQIEIDRGLIRRMDHE